MANHIVIRMFATTCNPDKLVHFSDNDDINLSANPLEVPKYSEFIKLVRSLSIDTFDKAKLSNGVR